MRSAIQDAKPRQAPALGRPLHSRLRRALRWAGVSALPWSTLTFTAFFWVALAAVAGGAVVGAPLSAAIAGAAAPRFNPVAKASASAFTRACDVPLVMACVMDVGRPSDAWAGRVDMQAWIVCVMGHYHGALWSPRQAPKGGVRTHADRIQKTIANDHAPDHC